MEHNYNVTTDSSGSDSEKTIYPYRQKNPTEINWRVSLGLCSILLIFLTILWIKHLFKRVKPEMMLQRNRDNPRRSRSRSRSNKLINTRQLNRNTDIENPNPNNEELVNNTVLQQMRVEEFIQANLLVGSILQSNYDDHFDDHFLPQMSAQQSTLNSNEIRNLLLNPLPNDLMLVCKKGKNDGNGDPPPSYESIGPPPYNNI